MGGGGGTDKSDEIQRGGGRRGKNHGFYYDVVRGWRVTLYPL